MISKEQYEANLTTKKTLEAAGISVPDPVLQVIAEYESQVKQGVTTPIYSTLLAESKYEVTPKQRACVEETVEELLSDEENAEDPGLLLGKIQCGKTQTFERIIALAFDKGFDIAIVLTKGTKALVKQTVSRLQDDFHTFKESNRLDRQSIVIEDIMDNRGGFNQDRLDRAKTIIVAKKETTNLDYLIKIFSGDKNEWMRSKKVLIVDDEADFASRNYRGVPKSVLKDEDGNLKGQENKIALAVVSRKIDTLRTLPHYCRYLQVTATPYCLFLQPDGQNLNLEDGDALPFRPRFSKIVPVHDKYVGGFEYFDLAHNEDSPFSHLYHPVTQKNIDVLGHQDKRYLKSGIASGNVIGLTYALLGYLMATAVRRVQERGKERYQSSAVFHVDITKKEHGWQKSLMNYMVSQIGDYFTSNKSDDERLNWFIKDIYEDFKLSSEKARTVGKQDKEGNTLEVIAVEYPSLDEIKDEVTKMFNGNEISIKVVNTDNDVPGMLDRETGQLRLDSGANIFIGGSILDRGITINNLLCFFYGRDPKGFQQDTVLQHARFYGARKLKDIAVTRLYTTDFIYHVMKRMNALDDQLREWIINGFSNPDPRMMFVGYDRNIRPCAPSKIRPSNTLSISAGKLFAPQGMMTGKQKEICETVTEIDRLITSAPDYENRDENGFFYMEMDLAMKILRLIQSTYRYDSENAERKGDMLELEAAFHYCSRMAGGRVLAVHRTKREMSRVRQNGAWVDMPADGRSDLVPSRARSRNVPVLMLLRQNGAKRMEQVGVDNNGKAILRNIGWNDTPFYWPVFLTQDDIESVLFAAGVKEQGETLVYSIDEILGDIDPDDVLVLRYKYNLTETFGEVGIDYDDVNKAPKEVRAVRDTTARKYLLSDLTGEIALSPEVKIEGNGWADVYSFNKGNFPFILKDYKYLLLHQGRGASAQAMLLELFPQEDWNVFPHQQVDQSGYLTDYLNDEVKLVAATDTIINRDRSEVEDKGYNVCQWVIEYPVKRVIKHICQQMAESTDENASLYE